MQGVPSGQYQQQQLQLNQLQHQQSTVTVVVTKPAADGVHQRRQQLRRREH
jgi:hypothetical protein